MLLILTTSTVATLNTERLMLNFHRYGNENYMDGEDMLAAVTLCIIATWWVTRYQRTWACKHLSMTFGDSSSLKLSCENVCVFHSLFQCRRWLLRQRETIHPQLTIRWTPESGCQESTLVLQRVKMRTRLFASTSSQLYMLSFKRWGRFSVISTFIPHFFFFCFTLMLSYEHWTYKVDTRELLSNNFNSVCEKRLS